uniref:hypothetical protein n=1 Tax=Enterobacter hormaechei TaxID=158836 RepID=UPI0013D211E1
AYASLPGRGMARPDERRWTSWGTAYAGAGSFAGHAALGSSGLSTRAAGIAAGADYRVDAGTLVGFAISGTSLNYGLGG